MSREIETDKEYIVRQEGFGGYIRLDGGSAFMGDGGSGCIRSECWGGTRSFPDKND